MHSDAGDQPQCQEQCADKHPPESKGSFGRKLQRGGKPVCSCFNSCLRLSHRRYSLIWLQRSVAFSKPRISWHIGLFLLHPRCHACPRRTVPVNHAHPAHWLASISIYRYLTFQLSGLQVCNCPAQHTFVLLTIQVFPRVVQASLQASLTDTPWCYYKGHGNAAIPRWRTASPTAWSRHPSSTWETRV